MAPRCGAVQTVSLGDATHGGPPASGEAWPSYNGSHEGTRYSSLTQIDRGNASGLKEVCRVRAGELGPFHSAPIYARGMVFVTTTHVTTALDPSTCEIIWRAVYAPDAHEPYVTSQGAVFDAGKIFRGTSDGKLLAYDAATGRELWRTVAADSSAGEWVGAAPIVWQGTVLVGLSGGEWGIKGRMLAFDAADGHKRWQFNLVPQDGEPGADTWGLKSNQRGGGATWTSFSLDPDTGEVFVPVGNPAPDFDAKARPGINLYTNSAVVLDATTGKLRWWYQITPYDFHDTDLGAPPMLLTTNAGRKLMLLGSKDGRVYAIDRQTHKLVYKTAVTRIMNEKLAPTAGGSEVCPGYFGGIEWNGPAFDALNHAVVVGAVDWCTKIYLAADEPYRKGELYMRGKGEQIGAAGGWLTSMDAASGKIRWKFDMHAAVLSAITPTAGGVIFAGDGSGNFYAFNSDSGTVLFKADTGGALAGGLITFVKGARQFVVLSSGNVSRSSFGASGVPTVVVYALASDASSAAGADADLGQGRALFGQLCSGCHGAAGEGAAGPMLKNRSSRLSFADTVQTIEHPRGAMPALYPSVLTEANVRDVAAFVQTLH